MITWNTRIIDFLQHELYGNTSLFTESPFYKSNNAIRKGELLFELTDSEKKSIDEFKLSIQMFSEHVFKNVHGESKKLIPIQNELLYNLYYRKYNLITFPRQSGVSTALALYVLHNIINERSVFYICPNMDSAEIFVEKVKSLYYSLHFYMKPGVKSWNAKSIEFDKASFIATAPYKGMINKYPKFKDKISIIMENSGYIDKFWNVYQNIIPYLSPSDDVQVTIHANTNDKEGKISTMISDSKNKKNIFYLNSTNISLMKFHGSEHFVSYDMIKKILSPEEFENEYELSWIDKPIQKELAKDFKKIENIDNFSVLKETVNKLIDRITELEQKLSK